MKAASLLATASFRIFFSVLKRRSPFPQWRKNPTIVSSWKIPMSAFFA